MALGISDGWNWGTGIMSGVEVLMRPLDTSRPLGFHDFEDATVLNGLVQAGVLVAFAALAAWGLRRGMPGEERKRLRLATLLMGALPLLGAVPLGVRAGLYAAMGMAPDPWQSVASALVVAFAVVTYASLPAVVWLLAGKSGGQSWVKAPLLGSVTLAVLLMVLVGVVGLNSLRTDWLYGYQAPQDEWKEAVLGTQAAVRDFVQASGCYPLSMGQLYGSGPLPYGADAAGNRVALSGPPPGTNGKRLRWNSHGHVGWGKPDDRNGFPEDPLTGRTDTWVLDPLEPGVVRSSGMQVRVGRERRLTGTEPPLG